MRLNQRLTTSFFKNYKTKSRYSFAGFSEEAKVIPTIPSTDPEFGNVLDIGKIGGYHHYLKKHHKNLGTIFNFWVYKDKVVSLGHPKYWSSISHLQDRTSHIRMFLRPLFGTSKTVNLSNGADRAERYKNYINPLFNKTVVDTKHAEVFYRHNEWMLEKWNQIAERKGNLAVQETFAMFVLSNMIEILFGRTDVKEEEMVKLFDDLSYCVVEMETRVLAGNNKPETDKAIYEKINSIHEFIINSIKDRVAENPETKTCLVDFIRHEKDIEVIFTDAITFFFGSVHTTISHLAFTVYHLANNQDKQAKLHEEIDKHLDEGPVAVKQLRNLKYVRACLNESLRLTPPVSTSARIDRENDVPLPDGHVIPKGTPIVIPLGLVLRDETLWKDEDKYVPERFKEDGVQWSNQFSPFGFAGGRVCPGRSLVQVESQLVMATLFKNFKVVLSKDQGPMKLWYLTGTTAKEEVYVNLIPRKMNKI